MEEQFGSWSVLTTNFLYILYIALGGIIFCAVLHLTNAKWRFQVRELACAFSALFPIAGVLLLILLANGDATFAWRAALYDGVQLHHHISAWNNYTFLVIREILGFVVVCGACYFFIKWQKETTEDEPYGKNDRFRWIAIAMPFIYFLYGTMVAWDFEMTQVPGWRSASYGAYFFQSNFHMFLAFFTIFLYFANKKEALVNEIEAAKISNYMAQFMLGMTILWTYLYFTQYLIMWYGRLPEEMDRYNSMMLEGFGGLWWLFLTLKFIIPFTTLAITPNRHNPAIVGLVATSIVVGTWIERYTWIAGSVDSEYYHMPMTSMFDIVVTLIVAALGWYAVRQAMLRYRLIEG